MVGSNNTLGLQSLVPRSTAPLPTASPLPVGAATGPVAGAPALPAAQPDALSANMQMMGMMAQVLFMVAQMCANKLGSGGGTTQASAPAPATAGSAGASAGTAATGQQAAPRANARPRVAVIDDFTSNQNGFQHGTEVANSISSAAGGNVDIERFNISGQGAGGITGALRNIVNQARAGNKVDVVNISQFFPGNNAEAQQLINELEGLGIPVVVAAGNNGPNQRNGLASDRAFIAGNGTGQSGPGNVRGNGRTTSFAAADVSGRIAQMLSQGQSLQQIRQQLGAPA
jgi:methylmalonyl-CoA mutase cobalamin-binding subunit